MNAQTNPSLPLQPKITVIKSFQRSKSKSHTTIHLLEVLQKPKLSHPIIIQVDRGTSILFDEKTLCFKNIADAMKVFDVLTQVDVI